MQAEDRNVGVINAGPLKPQDCRDQLGREGANKDGRSEPGPWGSVLLKLT